VHCKHPISNTYSYDIAETSSKCPATEYDLINKFSNSGLRNYHERGCRNRRNHFLSTVISMHSFGKSIRIRRGETFRDLCVDYTEEFYSFLLLERGCKAIYVPDVTVQPDRDLQHCAELNSSLTVQEHNPAYCRCK
jgi:hypothetical protein